MIVQEGGILARKKEHAPRYPDCVGTRSARRHIEIYIHMATMELLIVASLVPLEAAV